ncbi:orotidine-5'-phosphate decarboxylase [Parvularcula sp. LCG005]|uniref:orotidine-5'-phosphate decarboxylase n=1 Tax=Parvularcula sp. LCG005 TaxID=3078805 RepID=UPI002943093A|nr:orotidine-5'-phosphate decarboxylase [Parvularcula sp. LCG005]WOI53358.1 orotidine-5'-phosphate decarboxylase [Parvularcula sp. LCG005]
MTPSDRLIIALDVPSIDEAASIVDRIGEAGHFYKIGYQLFPLGGYDLARSLVAAGRKVFIDAKLLDIGATVERGVKSLTSIGATVLTVHSDPDTIKGAVAGRGDSGLGIFAVTVLTSWDQATVARHGLPFDVLDLVLHRAEIAAEAGADGVIASAAEAQAIKARFGEQLKIITPGIRPSGAAVDDQKRVITPRDAVAAGADHLVVGRPIIRAEDPAAAARAILADL